VGVRDLHGQLKPEGPHIVHNGAQVRVEGRPLRTWPLGARQARELARFCHTKGLYAEFFVGEEFLVTDRREEARPHWEHVTGEPAGLIEDLDFDATEVIKATIVAFHPRELPAIFDDVGELGLVTGAATSPLAPGMTFVNVTSPQADKGKALVYVAGHLGCELSEVVAVGDGMNDLSMLAVAGTAMAMGQAPIDVQQEAHMLVPEVEADGVAHALRAAATWRTAAAD
jgi:hydroxymethylpyrimidine pyrophosphatase-like HAD family hydrolase